MERYSKQYSSKWQSQYSEEFKQMVIQDFLTGSLPRTTVEKKYNIGNSRLTAWLKKAGYNIKSFRGLPLITMGSPIQPNKQESNPTVQGLKKELEDAKLLAELYKRMIEKAEQELKIDIRKKYNTK